MSYLCQLAFPPWCGASSAKCLLSWHRLLSDNTDIFLNQQINFIRIRRQIFTTKLHTENAVLPHNVEIVLWPQITVTSLHPTNTANKDVHATNATNLWPFRTVRQSGHCRESRWRNYEQVDSWGWRDLRMQWSVPATRRRPATGHSMTTSTTVHVQPSSHKPQS